MEKNQNETTWRTDNLNLAAYLWSSGFRPQVVPSENNPAKVNFEFIRSDELDGAVVAFLQGHASVNPATFDLVKTQIHNQIRAVLRGRKGGQR